MTARRRDAALIAHAFRRRGTSSRTTGRRPSAHRQARSWSCSRRTSGCPTRDRALIELFTSRLSVAFDNVILYEQLQEVNARREHQRTSELYRANQRLKAQRTSLRRANEFKSEMLGTVAHDLQSARVILGRAEILTDLLAMEPVPSGSMQQQLGRFRETAKRLTRMVDDLVVDAMNDALDISIRQRAFDVAVLVGDVVASNRPLAERKQQTIFLQGPESVPLSGDQERLREAIDNLVGNAAEAQPVGGRTSTAVAANDREAILLRSGQRPRPVPGGYRTCLRPLPAATKPSAGELDGLYFVDRQEDRRAVPRRRRRRESRLGTRSDVLPPSSLSKTPHET